MSIVAVAVVFLSWVSLGILAAWNHRRIAQRRAEIGGDRVASQRRPAANWGILLEALGIGVVFSQSVLERPWALAAATVLAPLSTALFGWALIHLGLQWRIDAVVTEDHRLVTTGPYALVRHPIYAALAGLLIATGLLTSPIWRIGVGLLLYAAGTEIRIRAEEALLAARFGAAFTAYRRRVKAYLPGLR